MKKVIAALVLILVAEVAYAYSPEIAEAVNAWLSFKMEMTIVAQQESGEVTGSDNPELVFVSDVTGQYTISGDQYFGVVEQGQHLTAEFFVKNKGSTAQVIGLMFVNDVSAVMTYEFSPALVEILPNDVVMFTWQADVLADAPVGAITINGVESYH